MERRDIIMLISLALSCFSIGLIEEMEKTRWKRKQRR